MKETTSPNTKKNTKGAYEPVKVALGVSAVAAMSLLLLAITLVILT